MGLMSDREMAQLCQTALADIIQGKVRSYSIQGRTFTRENLTALRELERTYRSADARRTYGRSHFLDMS